MDPAAYFSTILNRVCTRLEDSSVRPGLQGITGDVPTSIGCSIVVEVLLTNWSLLQGLEDRFQGMIEPQLASAISQRQGVLPRAFLLCCVLTRLCVSLLHCALAVVFRS